MPPVSTSIYHIKVDEFEIFHQYLKRRRTYSGQEHLGRILARTGPNTKVGSCRTQLAQRWVSFPLEIQARVSETTAKLTIVKGSPDRPVVFCRN